MPHDLFISYPSENKAVADAVCAALEARKVRCWIAPRDVRAGEAYAVQILNAVGQSRAMVLVFSGHANDSPHIMREVEAALGRGLPILPLRIENIEPAGSLDYYLKTIHWLDALTPPLEAHLEKLADNVQHLLGAELPAVEPAVLRDRSGRPAVSQRGKRWLFVAAALVAVLLIGGLIAAWIPPGGATPSPEKAVDQPAQPPGRQPTDLDRLQGFWTLVASEQEGKRESVAEGDLEIEFRGAEMLTYERPHPPTGGPIIFREDINPRGFDQVFEYERDGKKFRGRITWIYRFLDEDHLEMAYPSEDSFDQPSALVPRSFDSTKEKISVVTLERKGRGK